MKPSSLDELLAHAADLIQHLKTCNEEESHTRLFSVGVAVELEDVSKEILIKCRRLQSSMVLTSEQYPLPEWYVGADIDPGSGTDVPF